jgi:DNA polymerase III subunit beta
MNFIIERDILAVALGRVVPVISRSSTIPILTCIKLSASGSTLVIAGSNMEIEVRQTCSATVGGAGEVCTEASKLAALVNTLPKGSQVQFSTDDRRLVVKYGKGSAKFLTWPADDYPTMTVASAGDPLSIDGAELARILEMTLVSAYVGAGRDYIRGVNLYGDEMALRAVATNGHVMTVGRIDAPIAMSGVIVPRDAVALLIRILNGADGDVEVTATDRLLRLTIGQCVFTTKLVDGTSPDWERVRPEPVEHPILVDSHALKEVAERAQAITEAVDATKARPRAIRLSVDGTALHISAGSAADQQLDEDIEVEYGGASVEVALSTTYILDAIGSLGEGLMQIHVRSASKPVLMRRDGNDAESVTLMPMRV